MEFTYLEGVLKHNDPERGRKLSMGKLATEPSPGMILQVTSRIDDLNPIPMGNRGLLGHTRDPWRLERLLIVKGSFFSAGTSSDLPKTQQILSKFIDLESYQTYLTILMLD